ncbi:BTB/POZ domain-containing protein KCTD14 [Gouania willdenowi]|uniref:BTB domain-containing protein n=1 Tax=Gouania willdenowi TaxID=441366 RepID=A0A8C5E273_GOUWI|nr:BTB/POZ domain-containing protein KCTD14 [Gouania willdenowi]
MSLPERKHSKQPAGGIPGSSVVQINVGGHLFYTTYSTLRKHPESKLAELLSGSGRMFSDRQGNVFIDRDASHFGAVLEFLRSEELPTENIPQVYKEALHYNIKALIKALEETPQMFGEMVGRQHFISKVPNYRENIEVLIRIGRAEAVGVRRSTILVCVLQTDEDLEAYETALQGLQTHRGSVVTFGPWKTELCVKDLLDCVRTDIQKQGYTVNIEPHVVEKSFLQKSYDFFYKLTFTWW